MPAIAISWSAQPLQHGRFAREECTITPGRVAKKFKENPLSYRKDALLLCVFMCAADELLGGSDLGTGRDSRRPSSGAQAGRRCGLCWV